MRQSAAKQLLKTWRMSECDLLATQMGTRRPPGLEHEVNFSYVGGMGLDSELLRVADSDIVQAKKV